MLATPEAADADALRARVERLLGTGDGSVPGVRPRAGTAVPPPYRELLEHEEGMTRTLEDHFEARLHLRVLRVERAGAELLRHVLLVASRLDRPVGFGAIRMDLDRFAGPVRDAIVDGRVPLGTLLEEHRVAHRARLTGLFEVPARVLGAAGVDVDGVPILYGRHRWLETPAGETMAEVVEILPPIPASAGRREREA